MITAKRMMTAKHKPTPFRIKTPSPNVARALSHQTLYSLTI